MKPEPNAPADTRMMGIVHRALLRDLARAADAITRTPPPRDLQREAISEHLKWMMQFLHHHHSAEDEGLYPLIRQRNRAAADLLDEMSADHESIAPAIALVESAAAEYGHSEQPAPRQRLIASLASLELVLVPHLRREEEELMPMAATALTNAEWVAWDQQYNVKPRSLAELGITGHWLIDDVDDEDREVVVSVVPPIARYILLHGFAGRYRRQRARWWSRPVPHGRRVQKDGRTEVTVDVDPGLVWEVVQDMTRVGEWSHECVGIRWLGGASQPMPGARFRGRNRSGLVRWGRVCEVVDVSRGELAWRTVPTALYPDSVEWRIRVHAGAGGTHIEQTFHVIRIPAILDRAYATILPGHRDRSEALAADLRRLAQVAAQGRVMHLRPAP
jgi:hemerythrin-like domain-containing protein